MSLAAGRFNFGVFQRKHRKNDHDDGFTGSDNSLELLKAAQQ